MSETFLYAAGSSWSLNIVMERHAEGKSSDEGFTNLILAVCLAIMTGIILTFDTVNL